MTEDFYEQEGCCMTCPDSYPGCLCYDCMCTKCLWYMPPEEYDGEKGHCGMIDELAEQRKAKKEEDALDAQQKFIESVKAKFPCVIYSKVGLNPNQLQLNDFN